MNFNLENNIIHKFVLKTPIKKHIETNFLEKSNINIQSILRMAEKRDKIFENQSKYFKKNFTEKKIKKNEQKIIRSDNKFNDNISQISFSSIGSSFNSSFIGSENFIEISDKIITLEANHMKTTTKGL